MALTSEEITKIVQSAFAKVKDTGKPEPAYKQSPSDDKKQAPDYYPYYRQCILNVEAIMTHAIKGYYPEHLFRNPSPNQTDAEAKYIRDNYKQTTLPVYIDYMSTIMRAFHDNNWDIDYSREEKERVEEETFRTYVEEELPVYGSLEKFVKDILLNAKTQDAMALLAVRPFDVTLKEVDGEMMVDDSRKINPYPVIYACRQVVDMLEGDWYCVETKERSMVVYGNVKYAIGRIYEIYDDQFIWRAVQVGKYLDGTFEISVYYPHNLGKVPARRLAGVPIYLEGSNQLIYFSPFLFATDLLDRALLNDQYLQMSINYCTFPYRVMIGDICEFIDNKGCKCEDGMIADVENARHYRCPKCDGIGLVSRVSRLGTLLLRPATRSFGEGDSQLKQDPMKYVSPSTETLKFLEEKIDKDLVKGRKILHLRDSDEKTQFNPDTATSSANDLKATHAFVKSVSDQTFDLYDFLLSTIGWFRYGDNYIPVKLSRPKNFDLATEADYLMEINENIKAGLAPAFIQQILLRFIRAMYGDDENTSRVFALIVAADRLLTLTTADITSKMSRGTVARWEEILHTSALTLVQELIRAENTFLDQDLKVQIEKLIALAKAKEAEIKSDEAAVRGSLIDDLTGGA